MSSSACSGCSSNIEKQVSTDAQEQIPFAYYLLEQLEIQEYFGTNYLDGIDIILALEVKREMSIIKYEEYEKMKNDRRNH